MITDPTVALRAELTAALAILEPQLRGIADWLLLPESPELRQEIIKEGERRTTRKLRLQEALDACESVIHSINNLDEDDYPNLPIRKIPPDLIVELQADDSDINKAAALFEAVVPPPPVTLIEVNLGNPVEKT